MGSVVLSLSALLVLRFGMMTYIRTCHATIHDVRFGAGVALKVSMSESDLQFLFTFS
jgi:hypothetical protein